MYQYYNPNPLGKSTGDCVVRALSKALNKTWDEVYILLCFEGFIHKDWGNVNSVWGSFLRSQGYKRYIIPNTCPDCYSIGDFARDNPNGKFIVATGTHVVAIIDGVIYDSFDSSDLTGIYYFCKE